jgi:hypothetical protein
LADPYTKATKAGSPAVAEGRGLLAVGSVGLAIEAFRKALRDDPRSVEALAGLAECYDQMGRHDLSQAKYEAALAIAPTDPTLLRTFAVSLERQGRFAEAKELRGEAATVERAQAAALIRPVPPAPVLVQAQSAPAPAKLATVRPQPVPVRVGMTPPQPTRRAVAAPVVEPHRTAVAQNPVQLQLTSKPLVTSSAWAVDVAPIAPPQPAPAASVTVKLPRAAPPLAEAPKIATAAVSRVETPKVAIAAPTPVDAPKVAIASSPRVEPAKAVAVPVVPRLTEPAGVEPVAAPPVQPVKVAAASAAPSVTVKLPPARPAAAPLPEKPVEPAPRQIIAEATPLKVGPRLERLSMGEVALLTDPRPRWRDQARQVAVGTRPRFVALADLQRSYGVRLLNAARHEGLAARTRFALNRQGWKSVTIGDSARIRQRSLVLYSEKTEKAARRLAAQFGFWIAKEARPGPLTILLGRDWANRSQSRA